jgi:hypothetical protein
MKKDKGKEKEVARFPGLSVIHETEMNEDVFRDLFGVPTEFNTESRFSLGFQSVPNIRLSHSKCTEKSALDSETRSIRKFIVESSSLTTQKTVSPPRSSHLLSDASKTKDSCFGDSDPLGVEDEVDLSEWEIQVPDIDCDDDMDGVKSASLWDREKRVNPLTQKELDFCRKVFNSATKPGSIDRRVNRFEQRGERIYNSGILVRD